MALAYNELKELMLTLVHADKNKPFAYSKGGVNLSYSQLDETLSEELRNLSCDYRTYATNKLVLHSLIGEVIDDVLPARVMETYGIFANVKTFAQGVKPVFTQRITAASKLRAKQFIGKVGLGGRFEVFKLAGSSYEVPVNAMGGAAQISIEEFLDHKVDITDVLSIVLEGLDEAIFYEIAIQMNGGISTIQAKNKVAVAGFVEAEMDKLLAIGDGYGHCAIYCTAEFAATIAPSDTRLSDSMKDRLWSQGYLTDYKNHVVVILPQSYEDSTNSAKCLPAGNAWIMPEGANNKPVDIAFEGESIVKDYDNRDNSMEIQIYKKVGVGVKFTPDMLVYQNTAL